MNNTKDHNILLDKIMFAFGSRPDVRIWKRVVGFDQVRRIKYGIKGESDLQGIVMPNGRMLCIEIKTGKAVLNKDQLLFKAMAQKFGAIYIEARLDSSRNFDEAVNSAIDMFQKLK